MADPRIKTWLDVAPVYLDFAIKFFRNPRTAFAGVPSDERVSADLTGVLLGGVGLAYVIVLTVAPADLAGDRGTVATLIRRFANGDALALPAAALLATLLVGIVTHLMIAASRWSRLSRSDVPAPRMEGSVNATLGFSGVFVPMMTCASVQASPTWPSPS